MKRNVLIIIGALVIISLVIGLIVFTTTKKEEKEGNNGNPIPTVSEIEEKEGNNGNPIPTVSEIELNSEQYINQLEEVKIKGTNDTVIITKQVKWEVPEHDKGETVSFAIAVPYAITVDGQEYDGTYRLGSSRGKAIDDDNPKYNFQVTNLTKNGDIEVLITNK